MAAQLYPQARRGVGAVVCVLICVLSGFISGGCGDVAPHPGEEAQGVDVAAALLAFRAVLRSPLMVTPRTRELLEASSTLPAKIVSSTPFP